MPPVVLYICDPPEQVKSDPRYKNLHQYHKKLGFRRFEILDIIKYCEKNNINHDILNYTYGVYIESDEDLTEGERKNMRRPDKRLSVSEIERLHSFTEEVLGKITDKFDIKKMEKQFRATPHERVGDTFESDHKTRAFRVWTSVLYIQKLTRIATDHGVNLCVISES